MLACQIQDLACVIYLETASARDEKFRNWSLMDVAALQVIARCHVQICGFTDILLLCEDLSAL